MPYPNQFSTFPQSLQYQPQAYAQQIPGPMDRLTQMQNQQYQMVQAAQQPPQTNQGLLWVQGEAGAKSYLVAPNTTVLLMDSEGSRFYLKSTDNAGMPSLRVFEYAEVSPNAPRGPQSAENNLDDKYVTREEYKRLQAQYAEIMDKLDSFHDPVVVSEERGKSTAPTNRTRNKGGDANE